MLVAPTELRHSAFRELAKDGRGSNKPETMGGDFAFSHKGNWYIVQRKEIKDFVASVNDGRLYTETRQMKGTVGIGHALLVVEGSPKWGLDGALLGDRFGGAWDKARHTSELLSLQESGWWVLGTSDTTDTARAIRDFEAWVRKEKHTSLVTRGPMVAPFGSKKNRDYQLHLIMGLPGVGYELAVRILAEVGMPFGMRATRDELMAVTGLGKKKVEAIMDALDALEV